MQKAVIGETFFDYLIYLPNDYDGIKKYPLVLYLHGAGERANTSEDIFLLKRFGPPKLCDLNDYDAIIVSPQVKQPWTWSSFPEKLKDFLEEIIKKYSVDENAVSITGVSMGCFGMYQVLMDYPNLFSGAVAVCGGGMDWRSDTIKDLPLRIYHGKEDWAVSCVYAQAMYEKLLYYGAKKVELNIIPNMGHNVWDVVYEDTDALSWLIRQRNDDKI